MQPQTVQRLCLHDFSILLLSSSGHVNAASQSGLLASLMIGTRLAQRLIVTSIAWLVHI